MQETQAILRQLIREELAKNVPNYQVERVVNETVESLKAMIVRDINVTVRSVSERRKSMLALDEVMKGFSEDLTDLIESKLLAYSSYTLGPPIGRPMEDTATV